MLGNTSLRSSVRRPSYVEPTLPKRGFGALRCLAQGLSPREKGDFFGLDPKKVAPPTSRGVNPGQSPRTSGRDPRGHQPAEVSSRQKILIWKSTPISAIIRLDARAETKTNHSRRSPAPASANRPNPTRRPIAARLRQARLGRSRPKRRPAPTVRSPTRRVITCTSRRRLGASARISHGKLHGALRHGPPRTDSPPTQFIFEGRVFRSPKFPKRQGTARGAPASPCPILLVSGCVPPSLCQPDARQRASGRGPELQTANSSDSILNRRAASEVDRMT